MNHVPPDTINIKLSSGPAVVVDFYYYPGEPALGGHPDHRTPGEPDEIEIQSVWFCAPNYRWEFDSSRNAEFTHLLADISPLLSDEDRSEIEFSIRQFLRRQVQQNQEDQAADRAADRWAA